MGNELPKKISLKWCKENSKKDGLNKEDSIKAKVMPFGKHQGTPMEEVPAHYFNWLWLNGMSEKKDPVANYIRENLLTLKKEYPQGW